MKKLRLIFLTALTVFCLTGCYKIDYGIKINSATDADISCEVLLAPMLSADMSEDDIKATFEDSAPQDGREFKYEFIEKTINGETWKGLKATSKLTEKEASELLSTKDGILKFSMTAEKFTSIFGENPSNNLGSDMLGGSDLTEQENGEEIDLEADSSVEMSGTEDLEELMGLMETMEMKLSVTMPNQPTTNIGEINGNTVTVDLLTSSFANGGTLTITCESGEPSLNNIIAISCTTVVVITFAGIVIYLLKKGML